MHTPSPRSQERIPSTSSQDIQSSHSESTPKETASKETAPENQKIAGILSPNLVKKLQNSNKSSKTPPPHTPSLRTFSSNDPSNLPEEQNLEESTENTTADKVKKQKPWRSSTVNHILYGRIFLKFLIIASFLFLLTLVGYNFFFKETLEQNQTMDIPHQTPEFDITTGAKNQKTYSESKNTSDFRTKKKDFFVKIVEIHHDFQEISSEPALVVYGTIANSNNFSVRTPNILVSIRNNDKIAVHSWIIYPKENLIKSNSTAKFFGILMYPPKEIANIEAELVMQITQ